MKNTRKIFCNHTPTLKTIQQRILIEIARKDEGKLMTQKELSKLLKIKYTTLNHHIQKLRYYGLIDKYNELTDRGIKYIRYFKHWDKTFSKKLRAHKIQVTLNLKRCPPLKGKMFTPFTNKRYSGLKAEIKGSTVLFYSQQKAVVNLPDIFGKDDEEIAAALNDSILQMIEILEAEFPGLKVDDFQPARYNSIHIAILDSVFAELYILQNKSCFKGKVVGVDKSHKRFELEAESAKSAFEDIQLLVKVEDLVAENERMKTLLNRTKCPEMSRK